MGFVDAKHVMQCMQESRVEDRNARVWCAGGNARVCCFGQCQGVVHWGNARVWCGVMGGIRVLRSTQSSTAAGQQSTAAAGVHARIPVWQVLSQADSWQVPG